MDTAERVRASDVVPKRTRPIMSKYEFDTIIGTRTAHLARGAAPRVTINDPLQRNLDLRRVAEAELRAGVVPFIVRRALPDGTVEFWRTRELDLCAVRQYFISSIQQ